MAFVDPSGEVNIIQAAMLYEGSKLFMNSPLVVDITKNGEFSGLFDLAGFRQDESGIYHTKKDALQRFGGYNEVYDGVFWFAVDGKMRKVKFPFETENGDEYVIWGWKGQYWNLGTGAEVGIYSDSLIPGHWGAHMDLAFPMTLKLTTESEKIFDYRPSETQWWITGFNPFRKVEPDDLKATCVIDFSSRKDIFNGLYNKWNGKSGELHFDTENYQVSIHY